MLLMVTLFANLLVRVTVLAVLIAFTGWPPKFRLAGDTEKLPVGGESGGGIVLF